MTSIPLWAQFILALLVGELSGAGENGVSRTDRGAEASRKAHLGTVETYIVQPEYPLISRLGLWDGGQFNRLTGPGTITADHVYVLVHGWGIGAKDSVQAYSGSRPVEVWNPQIVDNNGQPAGAWLTDMARNIQAKDAGAAILAFTWIDDAATDANPLSGYISESHTEQNGHRLAWGLPDALGTDYRGQIHLIGFSHGSKVAALAAQHMTTLQTPIAPTHLTILDSPERRLTRLGGAANGLQYYLPQLNIGRGPGRVFVDNYYSAFGGPFNGYPGLQDIVDVELSPLTYSDTDFASRHFYAPQWYNKAIQAFVPGGGNAAVTGGMVQGEGIGWSPFFGEAYEHFNPSYSQQWADPSNRPVPAWELDLMATQNYNNPFLTTTTTALTFTAEETQGNAQRKADGTVVLDDSSGSAFWTAEFDLTSQDNGLLFQYQFLEAGDGDQLCVWINGELRLVITGSLAGQGNPGRPAISISAIEAGHMTMTLALYKYGSSKANVEVGNFIKTTNPNGETYPLLQSTLSCGAMLLGNPLQIPAFIGGVWLIRRTAGRRRPPAGSTSGRMAKN